MCFFVLNKHISYTVCCCLCVFLAGKHTSRQRIFTLINKYACVYLLHIHMFVKVYSYIYIYKSYLTKLIRCTYILSLYPKINAYTDQFSIAGIYHYIETCFATSYSLQI